MKQWRLIFGILAVLALTGVPVSATIIVTHVPNYFDTNPDGFSTVQYFTYPVAGEWGSMVGIERYRASGYYANGWYYFETVPDTLPNGARWNMDHGVSGFNGYYQVEWIDLNFPYSDDFGPDFVGWYADESATYQNFPGQITYVTVIPTYDPFGYMEYWGYDNRDALFWDPGPVYPSPK